MLSLNVLLINTTPVFLFYREIQAGTEIYLGSISYLFRPIRWYKSIKRYKLCGTKLSHTRCREIFKKCLEGIGCDSTLYGLHSLRAGGATPAVANNRSLYHKEC